MKTLIIKDLARTEELNHTAMAGVRGGMKMSAPDYKFGSVNISPSMARQYHVGRYTIVTGGWTERGV